MTCPCGASLDVTAIISIHKSYLKGTYPRVNKRLQRHVGDTSEDGIVFQSPTYFICLWIMFLDEGKIKYLLFPIGVASGC